VANVKISELPAATTLTGSEVVPLVQGTTAKRTTAADIAALAPTPTVAWDDVSGKPATFAPATHDHDDRYYTTGEVDALIPVVKYPPVAATFTAAADAYFPVHEAMTLNIAGAVTAGTGTFTFEKAEAATPTSFSAITTSTAFLAGDVLKISAASVTGYCAVTIPRTA
jgi:hypothetical protein